MNSGYWYPPHFGSVFFKLATFEVTYSANSTRLLTASQESSTWLDKEVESVQQYTLEE